MITQYLAWYGIGIFLFSENSLKKLFPVLRVLVVPGTTGTRTRVATIPVPVRWYTLIVV